MSHIERPLPTSSVRFPHLTSDLDFGRSTSHIERPIPTSCPRCPTRCCSATIHSADNSFQSPLLRGNVHDLSLDPRHAGELCFSPLFFGATFTTRRPSIHMCKSRSFSPLFFGATFTTSN